MAVPDVAYHSIVETPIHHPTYPPLTPSFGAFSLLFGDNRNDWILQAATSLLLVAALGVVVLGLIDECPSAGRHERWFHAVAAAFASSVLLGPLLRWGFTGYVDALVSVLTASVLVVGLT